MSAYFKVILKQPKPYTFCVAVNRLAMTERWLNDLVSSEALESHLQNVFTNIEESLREQLRSDAQKFRVGFYACEDQDIYITAHFFSMDFFQENSRYINSLIAMLSDTVDMHVIHRHYILARATGDLFNSMLHYVPVNRTYMH